MIIKTVPKDSRFIQVVGRFAAAFNVPTPGVYDFGIAANTCAVLFDQVIKSNIYMIDSYSFSATIQEGQYLEAINTLPQIQLQRQVDQQVIFSKPLPLVNYIDAAQSIGYFFTPRKDDALVATFSGILNQTAPLVGIASITAQVSFNIYEIIDSSWIKSFKEAQGPKNREYI
jgi:hypothetical protein